MEQQQPVATSLQDKAGQMASGYASRVAPWRQDISWTWVAVEGSLAVVIGIYFAFFPDSANSTIRFLLAAILIVGSVFDIFTGFRNYQSHLIKLPMTPYLLVRGGAGLAIGLTYFFAGWRGYMTESDARFLLGIGLVSYALIGLIGNIITLITADLKWVGLLANVLFLGIGIVLIYNNREEVGSEDSVSYIGYAALLGGAILLLYSYFLYRSQEQEPELSLADGAAIGLAGKSDNDGPDEPTSSNAEREQGS